MNSQQSKGKLTGNCPIREHTGDGAYVGRCEFACYDEVCPRHGWLGDYPTNDDREVEVAGRRFTAMTGEQPCSTCRGDMVVPDPDNPVVGNPCPDCTVAPTSRKEKP